MGNFRGLRIRSGGQSGVDRAAESEGTELGVREGMRLQKPMLTVCGAEAVSQVAAWLRALMDEWPDGIELCVGGPRESECAGAYRVTTEVLEGVLMCLGGAGAGSAGPDGKS